MADGVAVPNMRYAGPVAAGAAVIALFATFIALWSALAPLESAAIAPGVVGVDMNRKTVQHLEGGIVEHIAVRDGDQVREGQILLKLDTTKARASLDVLRGKLIAARALEARLAAEQDDAEQIAFPAALSGDRALPQVEEAMRGQQRIFAERRNAIERQVGILKQQSRLSHEEIIGLRGQVEAENRELKLLKEEENDIQRLVAQGLAPKPRLLALQRREAEIHGSRSRNVAAIARAEQTIAGTDLKIAELRASNLKETVQSLRDVQTSIFEIQDQIRAAEDVLRRTDIVAPIEGTVVGLQVHTTGGVIAPGARILDIVPAKERRIIDVRIDPADIDIVRPGLEARVRLTAYLQRNFVPLQGEVVSVSADRLTDDKSGAPFFGAVVALDADELTRRDDVKLHAGMAAEVMIVTGTRTLFDYIAQPLLRVFDRGFRES